LAVSPPQGKPNFKPNSLALCAKSQTQYNGQRSPIVLRLAGKDRASEAFAARNAKCARLTGANRTLFGCDSQDFCLAGIPKGGNSAGTDVQRFALLAFKVLRFGKLAIRTAGFSAIYQVCYLALSAK
jgi:hypothetical protein